MDFQNRCATAFFREYTNKASMEEKHDLVIKRLMFLNVISHYSNFLHVLFLYFLDSLTKV